MLAKNLNNAYFRDNVENDDVKNTGFNLFLFKDTIVKIEFEQINVSKGKVVYPPRGKLFYHVRIKQNNSNRPCER